MIDAVIFDFDGTLVDTTPVYLAVYQEVLRRELNLDTDERLVKREFGKRSTEILLAVLSEMEIDPQKVDIEHIVGSIRTEFISRLKDVLLLPGVEETLKSLRGDYKIALATASRPYSVNNLLEHFDIKNYFDVFVTADDKVKSKPAPDMFLLAANRLRIGPENCVVIEDAIHGIRAAKAAGMRVVAVTTGACSREELEPEKPDAIIETLKELKIGKNGILN